VERGWDEEGVLRVTREFAPSSSASAAKDFWRLLAQQGAASEAPTHHQKDLNRIYSSI